MRVSMLMMASGGIRERVSSIFWPTWSNLKEIHEVVGLRLCHARVVRRGAYEIVCAAKPRSAAAPFCPTPHYAPRDGERTLLGRHGRRNRARCARGGRRGDPRGCRRGLVER